NTLTVANNTSLGGSLTVTGVTNLNGATNIGNGNGDALVVDVTGSNMTINGVGTSVGTDVMMLSAANVVSRTPISSLIGADEGLTYNEGNNGKVRLGSLTNATNALTSNRFVNLGVSDLVFTTNNGTANVVVMNGDAANYGVAINAGGTGAVAITGTTAIIGSTTVGGSFTQSSGAVSISGATTINNTIAQVGGGQVTFSGNVDAGSGLDVVGLTTLTGGVTQIGTAQVTFGGNVDANNGLDVAGATTVTGATTLTGSLAQTGGTVSIGGATTMSNSSIKMTSLPVGAAADEILSIDVASGSVRRSTAAILLNDDVWLLDGNTTGGTKTMGSNDNFDVGFETNGTTRLTIEKDGKITQNGANQVTLAGNLDANGGVDVLGGNFTVGGNKFTVDVTNGNTAVAGTVDVT
ncbi:MAG: beta strand repeat-containing protein, partial [Ignavibacteria bacterium]